MHGGMRLKLRRIYCGLNQMNDLMPDLPRRVILFTKVPLPGQVKTRLMTCLSAEECASLQSSFIKDIVRACLESDAGLYIFYAPAEEITPLKECVPDSARLYRQKGREIGERMHNAFCRTLSECRASVLIGSDIPAMSSDTITRAFEALSLCDVVLAPSEDGGYSLIAMKEPHKFLFSLSHYSTTSVLEETLAKIHESDLSCILLETCSDVDTEEDLKNLVKDIENGKIDVPETKKFLTAKGFIK